MIPEFITAKTSTSRSAADAPSIPDKSLTDNLQNKVAFEKALRDRSSDPPAPSVRESRPAGTPDNVPAEPATSTVSQRRESEGRQTTATSDDSGRDEIQQPASTRDSTRSTSDDLPRPDVKRETALSDDKNEGLQPQPVLRESSKLIHRIDPANHSKANEAASQPTLNGTVADEASKPAADLAVPSFFTADDTNFGTLPSLNRLPLDDVSISQFSGDFIPIDTQRGQTDNDALQAVQAVNLESLNGENELRPLLNDALVTDDVPVSIGSRFTATDPSLIVDDAEHSPATEISSPDTAEDLLAIPTLPSLRPEVILSLPAEPPVKYAAENQHVPVSAATLNEKNLEGIRTTSKSSIALSGSTVEVSPANAELPGAASPVPVDDTPSIEGADGEERPLVLPSLASGAKRNAEKSPIAGDHPSDNPPPSVRKVASQDSTHDADSTSRQSSLRAPGTGEVQTAPVAQPVVIEQGVTETGRASQTVKPTDVAVQRVDAQSENVRVAKSTAESTIAAADQSFERSDSLGSQQFNTDGTAASSRENISNEQPVSQQIAAFDVVAKGGTQTATEQRDDSQRAEVAVVSTVPPAPTANVVEKRTDTGGVADSSKISVSSSTASR